MPSRFARTGRAVLVVGCAAAAAACSGGSAPRAGAPPGITVGALTRLDLVAGQPGGPGWVDGALAAAHFADPWAITGDGAGHLFVADGDTIREIDTAAGSVTTLAGAFQVVGGADGTGAQATFDTPSGLALAGGRLYVSDSENDTVRVIDPSSGQVATIAGAVGEQGFADGPGADARFQDPQGLAYDGRGALYVADTENGTIRSIALAGETVDTLAGAAGTVGATDGTGSQARFDKPTATALDGAGDLYVVDSLNHALRKLDPSRATVTTVATFPSLPQGVAVDGADVFVSLSGGAAGPDSRVVRVAADGSVTTFAGSAAAQGFVDGDGADARFASPAGLYDDGAGTLYVADDGNDVVRAVSLASGTVTTYAGAESPGSADGPASQARFAAPLGLAADEHTIYVADTGNDTIRTIDRASGRVATLAGAPGEAGFTDGALREARFDQPEGLALDAAARVLYVADTVNRAVRRVDLAAGVVTTLRVSVASPSFAGFDAPSGLSLDGGRLFVTDYTDDVVVSIDLGRATLTILAGRYAAPGRSDGAGDAAAFYGPLGIAADGRGHLYVADDLDETVRAVDVASGAVTTLAGEPVTPGDGDGVGTGAHFHYPMGVAADSAGHVFVADSDNGTVRRVDASTGAVVTVIGSRAASGVRLGPLPAQLTTPTALALTPSGELLLVSENSVLVAH